jgi:hypothetical protein
VSVGRARSSVRSGTTKGHISACSVSPTLPRLLGAVCQCFFAARIVRTGLPRSRPLFRRRERQTAEVTYSGLLKIGRVTRDRRFESGLLQQGVRCEPDFHDPRLACCRSARNAQLEPLGALPVDQFLRATPFRPVQQQPHLPIVKTSRHTTPHHRFRRGVTV